MIVSRCTSRLDRALFSRSFAGSTNDKNFLKKYLKQKNLTLERMVYTIARSLRYELSSLASNVGSFPSIVFYRSDVETFSNEIKNYEIKCRSELNVSFLAK